MSDFLEPYELYHYGIQGQKWGERRYQYPDGSYTDEGRRRYGIGNTRREISRLKGNLRQSEYNKNRSQRDLNRINKAGTIWEKRRSQLSEKDQQKYDIQKQIAAKMKEQYNNDKSAYVKAVKDAKAEYGNKNVKDIKRHINGDIDTRNAFDGFCLALGTVGSTVGSVYSALGPTTLHNQIPSYIVMGAGIGLTGVPNAIKSAKYSAERKRLFAEMSPKEQAKTLQDAGKQKMSKLTTKQKAMIAAGIIGAIALGSSKKGDPNIIEADWHEIIDALPLRD